MLRMIATILLVFSAAANVVFLLLAATYDQGTVILPRTYVLFAICNASFTIMCVCAITLGARREAKPLTIAPTSADPAVK